MTAPARVLVVGDLGLDRIRWLEAPAGPLVASTAASVTAAIRELMNGQFNCVVLALGDEADPLHELAELNRAGPDTAIVVVDDRSDDVAALAAIDAGAQDYLIAADLTRGVLRRAVQIAIARKQLEARLSHLAMHDELTGLPNRALFMDRARIALARAQRRPMSTAILFMDLDRFKLVNDSFGHEAGDQVLIEVAARFLEILRPSDSVARAGGDEFAVLCEDVRALHDAEAVAARIQRRLAEPFDVEGNEIHLSTSIGIAFSGTADESPEELLRSADTAMYRAKENRSDWEVFDAGMRAHEATRLTLHGELYGAVQRDELTLHYQPLVELGDAQSVVGVEALLRWRHPRRGLLLPDEFIGVVESTKLVFPIGRWVLDQALDQLARWTGSDAAAQLFVSVNVSVRQLEDRRFVDVVAAALEQHSLRPHHLCVELTETAVMVDPREAAQRLADLRSLGVRIAIDDFGTGYTSLSQLSRLPVDMLKVDRSFVSGLTDAPDKHSVVAAVISLADALGITTLAEGVESPNEAEALTDLGCQLAQGNWYSRARPPDELVQAGLIAPLVPATPSADTGLSALAGDDAIRVLLADDVPELRALMRSYLEEDPAITIVGDFSDGDAAVRGAVDLGADIVVLDLSMPKSDGLQAIVQLRRVMPEIGIIVLSGFDAAFMESRALALGANRYLEKGMSLGAIRSALHELARERAGRQRNAPVHSASDRIGPLGNRPFPPHTRRQQ